MMPWPPRGDEEPINWGDEPVEPPPPPSAGRSIRLAFGAVYDYAGSAIAVSLLAFVVFFTALSLLYQGADLVGKGPRSGGVMLIGLVLMIAPLILSPLLAGLFTMARAMFLHDDPHPFDVARGMRRLARPAWALGYLQTLVNTILISDLGWLLTRPETAMKLFGIVVLYVLLFWSMMMTYQWPLLVEQEAPVPTLIRRSFLLAAANPFYTLGITLLIAFLLLGPIAIFFAFSFGPVVLVPVSLLWGMLICGLQTSATLEILRKYDEPTEG